jgi:hypothetical protein
METNDKPEIPSSFEGAEFTERQTPTDFNGLLMYQIDSINKLGCSLKTDSAGDYHHAIEQLEILLNPYLDDKYDKYLEEKKEILESIQKDMVKTHRYYHVRRQRYCKGLIVKSRIKLRGLMSLCSRKNLFPGARINIRA